MRKVAIADARQVAMNTAPVSMPAAPSTVGCTNTMYAIVTNVVTPASTSVRNGGRSGTANSTGDAEGFGGTTDQHGGAEAQRVRLMGRLGISYDTPDNTD